MLAALAVLWPAPRPLLAQDPPPLPPTPPAVDQAGATDDVGSDPVGFLLEHKDTLRLAPDIVSQLVRINLDLFRQTRRVQRAIDSVAPAPSDALGSQRPRPLTPAQREALTPLLAELRRRRSQARDTAYELLTPDQQTLARALFLRARRATRGGRTRG